MQPIRVLLADDHGLFRQGLAALLHNEADIEVVGEAADGIEAVRMAHCLRPDVLSVDIGMPALNGLDVIRRVARELPSTRILCVSAHEEHRLIASALDAGAAGFVPKLSAFDEFARAVRSLACHQPWVGSTAAAALFKTLRARANDVPIASSPALTPRERLVLQLLAEGHSTREVAARLHVSPKTVGTHREHIMAKLGVSGIAQLTRYAIREGIV
jgi:DNA-binding NarL/FixJ family response regulator